MVRRTGTAYLRGRAKRGQRISWRWAGARARLAAGNSETRNRKAERRPKPEIRPRLDPVGRHSAGAASACGLAGHRFHLASPVLPPPRVLRPILPVEQFQRQHLLPARPPTCAIAQPAAQPRPRDRRDSCHQSSRAAGRSDNRSCAAPGWRSAPSNRDATRLASRPCIKVIYIGQHTCVRDGPFPSPRDALAQPAQVLREAPQLKLRHHADLRAGLQQRPVTLRRCHQCQLWQVRCARSAAPRCACRQSAPPCPSRVWLAPGPWRDGPRRPPSILQTRWRLDRSPESRSLAAQILQRAAALHVSFDRRNPRLNGVITRLQPRLRFLDDPELLAAQRRRVQTIAERGAGARASGPQVRLRVRAFRQGQRRLPAARRWPGPRGATTCVRSCPTQILETVLLARAVCGALSAKGMAQGR